MNKFKNLSSVLFDMIVMDIVYLIIGETIILIFLPNKEFYAIGFFVGVFISIFDTIHMKHVMEKSLHRLGKSAIKGSILSYSIRLLLITVIFLGMYFFALGDIFAGLAGMFALKISAYFQPLTQKVLNKLRFGSAK